MEVKEEKKLEGNVELAEVVTQTANAFKLPDGSVVSHEEYLVWIGNTIHKLTKKLIG